MGRRDHKARRLGQSLDRLENVASAGPATGPTPFVTKCLQLRRVPIGQLTVEELQLLIGQRDGLMFLVPLSLEELSRDPLVSGNYYPGDLLCVLLRAGGDFWRRHSHLRAGLEAAVAGLPEMPREVARALAEFQSARD